MLWTRPHEPQKERDNYYWTAIIITIVGNVLLAVGKSIVAKLTGSAALYADAANSISDVLYSVLMAFGLWMAIQPPDLSHPQGHSRFEPLIGIAVAFSMSIAGYEAGRASIERFISGAVPIALGLPSIVLGLSALIKAGMFVWIRNIANHVHSPSLNATAKDNEQQCQLPHKKLLVIMFGKRIHRAPEEFGGDVWIPCFKSSFYMSGFPICTNNTT